tara:strand:- start:1197 stop:1391 length:195 start_codon:yes stop_codon:yes gene_type:complete
LHRGEKKENQWEGNTVLKHPFFNWHKRPFMHHFEDTFTLSYSFSLLQKIFWRQEMTVNDTFSSP